MNHIIRQFQKLPLAASRIDRVNDLADFIKVWRHYNDFLKDVVRATHLIRRVQTGARTQEWISASSLEDFTQEDINVIARSHFDCWFNHSLVNRTNLTGTSETTPNIDIDRDLRYFGGNQKLTVNASEWDKRVSKLDLMTIAEYFKQLEHGYDGEQKLNWDERVENLLRFQEEYDAKNFELLSCKDVENSSGNANDRCFCDDVECEAGDVCFPNARAWKCRPYILNVKGRMCTSECRKKGTLFKCGEEECSPNGRDSKGNQLQQLCVFDKKAAEYRAGET